MFLDLLATAVLMQPSMSLLFTTIWAHWFVSKLFFTMNSQHCLLSVHFPASVVARGVARHSPELCDVPFGHGIATVVLLA